MYLYTLQACSNRMYNILISSRYPPESRGIQWHACGFKINAAAILFLQKYCRTTDLPVCPLVNSNGTGQPDNNCAIIHSFRGIIMLVLNPNGELISQWRRTPEVH